jgi:leucyl aminopeptidase
MPSPVHVAAAAGHLAPEAPTARRGVAASATAGGASSAGPTKARARLPSSPDDVALRPPSLTSFTDGGDPGAAADWSGDLLVLGVWADDLEGAGDKADAGDESEEDETADPLATTSCLFTDALTAAWDAKAAGLLSDAARAGGFKGKAGQAVSVRLPRAAGVRVATVVGLGKRADAAAGDPAWGASPYAGLGAAAAAAAKTHKAKSGAVVVTGAPAPGVAPADAAAALARGALTGAHAATRFKHGPAPTRLESAAVFGLAGGLEPGAAAGTALARGIMRELAFFFGFGFLDPASILPSSPLSLPSFSIHPSTQKKIQNPTSVARYLVEAPPNVCTPSHVARAAAELSSSAPDVLTLKTYGREECEKMGMGSFLAVARASAREPVLIHLTYTPPGGGNPALPPLALVGKGITFDSGGYNLKVGGMIESMKVSGLFEILDFWFSSLKKTPTFLPCFFSIHPSIFLLLTTPI